MSRQKSVRKSAQSLNSSRLRPAFFQAQWPVFLKPSRNHDYVKGIFHPSLPSDFDQLNEQSRTIALREWSQIKLAKAYEILAYFENRKAHDAMNVPHVFPELFTRCAEVSEVGTVSLHTCLIEGSQNWIDLGFPENCPFSFSREEIDTHEFHFVAYLAWQEVRALAEESLDTDAEGWITPQLDMAEKRKQNEDLTALYIEKVVGERSAEEVKAMWLFH